MGKESTGMFDMKCNEIFVGDTVKKCWGWWTDTGEDIREHVITKWRKDNTVEYRLGTAANFWRGEEVLKVVLNPVE